VTFTYSSTNITTDLAKVRLALGDVTDQTSKGESLTDEEINAILATETNVFKATLICCDLLLARLRVKVDLSAGTFNTVQNQKFQNLQELRKNLKEQLSSRGDASIYFGTTSEDRKQSISDDSDFIPPEFKVGMHDY